MKSAERLRRERDELRRRLAQAEAERNEAWRKLEQLRQNVQRYFAVGAQVLAIDGENAT